MGKPSLKAFALSLIAGGMAVAMLFAWSSYTLELQTRNRLMVSGKHIAKIIDNTRQVSRRALSLYGLPCTLTLRSRLQSVVVETPHMRAIELISTSNKYCSSVLSHGPEDDERFLSSGMEMVLRNGTYSAKAAPALIVREYAPQSSFSVLAEIDGYYISEMLSNAQVYPPVFFRVGNDVLTTDNRVREMVPPSGAEWYTLLYPRSAFDINYMITDRMRGGYLWNEYRWGVLCCVLLACIVFLALTKWGILLTAPQYALERALARHEFVPYIQPVVAADSRDVTGGEILLRWQHPEDGIIPPDQFIPLAESSGLIIDITGELFRTVREHLTPVVQAGYLPRGFHLGVNISPQHLSHQTLLQHCTSFLAAFPEDGLTLVLEITERERPDAHEKTLSMFKELKASGVKFALDDFGTGHSTYTWLQQFPVDYLKIDKRFVQMIGTDNISGDIVEHVIMLSRRLKIKTIAEGVENDGQSRYLTEHGVHYLQGYAFGRPVPLTDFIQRLVTTARL